MLGRIRSCWGLHDTVLTSLSHLLLLAAMSATKSTAPSLCFRLAALALALLLLRCFCCHCASTASAATASAASASSWLTSAFSASVCIHRIQMLPLPAFVPPPPPYPYLTAVRGYAPPDDLRIASRGRPPTCFGPRSYKPTPKDKIDVMTRHYIQPSASAGRLDGSTVRLESLPARDTEWREGFIRRKSTCK